MVILHARNVIVSRSSPRRILAILDWDFGGSQALPLADDAFEVSSPDSDQATDVRMEQGEGKYNWLLQIDELAGFLPIDVELTRAAGSTKWIVLHTEAIASAAAENDDSSATGVHGVESECSSES